MISERPAGKVPAVIITGFLGAGKTTLMEHTLASRGGKLLGFVVNDVAAINIDASLVRGASARAAQAGDAEPLLMVTLEDGCICCERSGDLLPCVEQLFVRKAASADARPLDAILIECTGLAEPNQLKRAFLNPHSPFAHVLEQVELAAIVTVVDAAAFQEQYESHARSRLDKQCVVDLLVAQVEAAQLIVLNKVDRLDARELELLEALLRALNSAARIVRARYSRVSLSCLLSAGRDLSEQPALAPSAPPAPLPNGTSAKRARAGVDNASQRAVHDSVYEEGEEETGADDACGVCERDPAARAARAALPRRLRLAVSSFTYMRDRPFHPVRLCERVISCMPTRRPRGQALFGAAERAAARADEGSAAAGPLAHLLRSKGFAWLASQPHACFRWAYAGCHFQLVEYCALGEEGQGDGDDACNGSAAPGAAGAEAGWARAGAVRGQRLVFIGLSLCEDAIVALLDSCLLADWEMPFFRQGLAPPCDPREMPSEAGGSIERQSADADRRPPEPHAGPFGARSSAEGGAPWQKPPAAGQTKGRAAA